MTEGLMNLQSVLSHFSAIENAVFCANIIKKITVPKGEKVDFTVCHTAPKRELKSFNLNV